MDRDGKREVYASLGMEEYWLYDPSGEHLATRLRGMRLVGGGYRELAPRTSVPDPIRYASSPGARTVRSTVLGLDVRVDRGGGLCLYDPVTGMALPGYEEEHVARKDAEARVAELEALVQEFRIGRTSPGGNKVDHRAAGPGGVRDAGDPATRCGHGVPAPVA